MTTRYLAACGLVVAALVAQAGLAPPAHAAGPRYASPTGTSAQNCLTAATACNIEKAFSASLSSYDEIVLAPGTYTTATALVRSQSGINVHGTPGAARPVINTSASPGLSLTGSGARVSDLTIHHTGDLYGLNVFSTGIVVQRVEVYSSGPISCGAGISGVVRDSVCANTATNGIALDDSWGGGTGTLLLRNVTAVASGTGSLGIRADASNNATDLDINARNVIAAGTTADVRATRTGQNSDSDVALQSSNYDTTFVGAGATVTTPGTLTNQKTAPLFADASFHQAPGSPTIDTGVMDAATGTVDLDGEARPYQGAMDIGADEFYPDVTPPETVLAHTPRKKTHRRKAVFAFSATEPASFLCKVDKKKQRPCSAPFKHKFKRYGKHRITITAVDTSGNVDPTPATYKWRLKKKKAKHHHARSGTAAG